MRMPIMFVCVALILGLTVNASARTWHVPAECPTIQAGIDAAGAGDTVLVADGTYTGDGNRDLNFYGKAIVVMSENGPDSTVIDCQGSEGDMHRGFSFYSGEDSSSVLEGFTITNGFAHVGGGILCSYSSPIIRGNVITGNAASSYGGGICCDEHNSAVIEGNIIKGNRADDNGYGGGIVCAGSSTINANSIIENSAFYHGGGIFCVLFSGTIEGNTISRNMVDDNWLTENCGAGIYCQYAWPAIIKGNIITGNWSDDAGGGICCFAPCSTIIEGNIISEDTADYGGGIYCTAFSSEETTLVIIEGTTIAENIGGGILSEGYSSVTVHNSIFWGNVPYELFGSGLVTYSDIQGGWPGEGNIDADPLFACHPDTCDTADYHLRWGSPCIDVGDVYTSCLYRWDIDGEPRIMDGDSNGVAIVDMGADEFPGDRGHADYGDALDPPYNTFFDNCGPRHLEIFFEWLGDSVDYEDSARVVDMDQYDDGVIFFAPYKAGAEDSVTFVVSTSGLGSSRYGSSPNSLVYVNAWFDWMHDGDWDDPGEHVVSWSGNPAAWAEDPESITVSFAVPEATPTGDLWVRFRLSYGAPVGVSGASLFGEVEDYFLESGQVPVAEAPDVSVPRRYALFQNYPNPFNPITEVRYALPADCPVKLEIYNILGQRVITLVDEEQVAGYKTVRWDSRDHFGEEVTSGIYLYRLKAGDFVETRKMILLR